MVNIRMTETKIGSEDGIHTQTYEEGQVYSCPSDLAKVFIDEGWGVNVDTEPAPIETKPTAKTRRKKVTGPRERK